MTAISDPDTAHRQKAMEGLGELACMIAAAYRRRVTGEADTAFAAFGGGEEKTAPCTVLEDLRHDGSYTEIVSVDNFVRRKVPKLPTQESAEKPEDSLRIVRVEARNGITECRNTQFSGPNTRMH